MRKAMIPVDMQDEFYTRDGAAEAVQLSVSTVDRLRKDGVIDAAHYFGTIIIRKDSVQRYLARFGRGASAAKGSGSCRLRPGAGRPSGRGIPPRD